MSRSHDLEETLANVTDLVSKRLDADVCSIYSADAGRQTLRLASTIGLDADAVGQVELPIGDGLVGLAAKRGEPIAMEHARSDPQYQYFPETGEERFESLLAAPLIVQGVVIGVIVIQTVEPRRFDEPDIELLQTCASLLAPVVANAQLLALMSSSDDEGLEAVSRIAESSVLGALDFEQGPAQKPPRSEKNVTLRGLATARGVAIGPIFRMDKPVDLERMPYQPSDDVAQEHSDFKAAMTAARRQIEDMRDIVQERFGPEFAAVFHAQIQILEDKGFLLNVTQAIERTGDARKALLHVLATYRKTFQRIEDPYLRERGTDIADIGQRVIERLLGVRDDVAPMPRGSVVVVDQLLPAIFAQLEMDKVSAIVAEHGGQTSHGVIFARTLEIPAVTGASGLLEEAREGEAAIVDGATGTIYLSPDEALTREFEQAQHQYEIAVEHLDAMRERPAETLDGHRVRLSANAGLLADLRLVEKHGAEGVGLFRTELLALAHRGFPSEEEQGQLYQRVVEFIQPQTVTLRTLDLGGDKGIPNIGLDDEENPQLGCRSIRLTLENRRAFRAQLRAILRASTLGNLKLLLPMIGSLDELREAKSVIDEVRLELDREGSAFDHDLKVGIMIEVPSAAITAKVFAQECDFFSIGTNDLTQYTLAVDRGNERVAHLYDSLHPAVLQLIAMSVSAANEAGIPISVCGEMATNPLAVPILVGLGIEELSGTPAAIPVVKEIIRSLDSGEVEADARAALLARTASEVHGIAAKRLRAAGLTQHPDIGGWLAQLLDEALASD
ncbi:MAG TPA: phosphoenolpyruvate--protein phosphotransferase [Myxococcales bacterium]|nr:phosphoenolpyruvate--protein phosphotransferase [Myxococcales bacterium]HIK85558.1 phosphoenolpyruvate--protein phosphotransferase [Myxococcales bacterium]